MSETGMHDNTGQTETGDAVQPVVDSREDDSVTQGSRTVGEYTLSDGQQEAIAVLSSANEYTKQSKWLTLRELPWREKLPFFAQHFLVGLVAIVAAVSIVGVLIFHFVTKPPEPNLGVGIVNMGKSSSKVEQLVSSAASNEGLDADLVSSDANLTLNVDSQGLYSESGVMDSTVSLTARIQAGDINTLIAPRATFESMAEHGWIVPLSQVLSKGVVNVLEQGGVTVQADVQTGAQGDKQADASNNGDAKSGTSGNTVENGASQSQVPAGLDLSHALPWTEQGLPADAVLAFTYSNRGDDGYRQALVGYFYEGARRQ